MTRRTIRNLVRLSATMLLPVFLSVFLFSAQPCQAQQAQSAWVTHPKMHAKWKAWRKTMKHTSFPSATGCFTASYPSTVWRKASCAPPPSVHYSSPATEAHPHTVGGGVYDYTAQAASSPLSSATGSFLIVTGYAPPPTGQYSLQLNTNDNLPTPLCSGAADPSLCSGWAQFVFDNNTSQLLIEYSLINWGSTNCPSGFNHSYPIQNSTEIVCYENTPVVDVPEQPFVNLPYLELTAQVSGSTNTAILSTADGNIYATQQTGLLGNSLALYWNYAEFNVFGDVNGDQVNFNNGSTFVVQTSVNNGTETAPYCDDTSYTGETNNLSLVGPCCPYGGTSPNIQFMESNDSAATASCGASGLEGNITSPAPNSSGTYVTSGQEYPTIEFTETLTDSAPGAEIYWQVDGCSGSTSGSDPVSSGGGFTLEYQSQYDCNPNGTMYAVVPGFLPSPTVSIDFP